MATVFPAKSGLDNIQFYVDPRSFPVRVARDRKAEASAAYWPCGDGSVRCLTEGDP